MLVLIGGIVNKWVLEIVFTPDGRIDSRLTLTTIAVFQLLLIASGIGVLVTRSPDRAATRPRRVRNWALALLALLIAVAMLEGVLALMPSLGPPRLKPRAYVGEHANRESERFIADGLTGWRMRPSSVFHWRIDEGRDTYEANAEGFRTRWESDSFRARPVRIALAGDSFAFGTGVGEHQSFGTLLELGRPDRALYNLAMPGFGIDQMWMSVRHQALDLEPTLVIVAFIDSDFDRSLTAFRRTEGKNKPTFVLDGGALRSQTVEDRASGLTRFLERHSAIWNLGRVATRGLGYRFPIGDWWKTNAAVFTEILTDCSNAGVPVLFVRLPLKDTRQFPQLRSLMSSLGADYLDLGDPERLPDGVHFARDAHLNEDGHKWVAEQIDAWIQRSTRVP
jgi:hypothetical protein